MQLLLILLLLSPMPCRMWEVGKGLRAIEDREAFGENHAGEGGIVSFLSKALIFFFRLPFNSAGGGDGEQ